MRHRHKKVKITNCRAHADSITRNLIASLIKSGKIKTTEKKAKVLRSEMEKLIARSLKRETVHAIREAQSVFYEKEVSKMFFDQVLPASKERKSGFVRTYKLGNRSGDNAAMVMVELIDYVKAEEVTTDKKEAKKAAPKAKKTESTDKAEKTAEKKTTKKATKTKAVATS